MDFTPRQLTVEEIELAMQLLYMDGEPMMVVSGDVRSVGELLRIKRTVDGYSQAEMAKKLKMAPSVLSDIENDLRTVPRRRIQAVHDYIYKELYLNGKLEFTMVDDEEELDYDEYL